MPPPAYTGVAYSTHWAGLPILVPIQRLMTKQHPLLHAPARLLVLVLLALVGCGNIPDGHWLVTKVADGDTVTLINNAGESRTVRLIGIDAPERSQAFGQEATHYLVELVHRETVTLEADGNHTYKHNIGVIFLHDTLNVNREMIRAGMAWRYHYNDEPELLRLQQAAQEAKRGLWQMAHPMDPWRYRRLPERQKRMY